MMKLKVILDAVVDVAMLTAAVFVCVVIAMKDSGSL